MSSRRSQKRIRGGRSQVSDGIYWVLAAAALTILVGLWWTAGQPRRLPDASRSKPVAAVSRSEAPRNRPVPVRTRDTGRPVNDPVVSAPASPDPPGSSGANRPSNDRPAASADRAPDDRAVESPAAATPSAIEAAAELPRAEPIHAESRSSEPRPEVVGRPVRDMFEAQLALDRLAVSPGSLDGIYGSQTRAAFLAFQLANGLDPSGRLDPATRDLLRVSDPIYRTHTVTEQDLTELTPISDSWLGKSQQSHLGYETLLEMAAEMGHSHPDLIRRINPSVPWDRIAVGTSITIPNVFYPEADGKAALIRIRLASKTLTATDPSGRLLAHFPCSIARQVDKRPAGELTVISVAENPNYKFNPHLFSQTPEARRIGKPLMIPPGPNNPVGAAWIGLSRPGYGIHGTPAPEAVGRTESLGCFRLANWNANYLLQLVRVGMPVLVEP